MSQIESFNTTQLTPLYEKEYCSFKNYVMQIGGGRGLALVLGQGIRTRTYSGYRRGQKYSETALLN